LQSCFFTDATAGPSCDSKPTDDQASEAAVFQATDVIRRHHVTFLTTAVERRI